MSLGDKFKSLGIDVKEPEKVEEPKKDTENKTPGHPILLTGDAIKYSLAEQALIPARYIDLEFDVDKLKTELKKEWSFSKMYTISNFSAYASLLSGILTDLRFGKLPDRSYLVGFYSSTELGNEAFAVNAIKLMYAQGMKVVPFISCHELCKVLNLSESMNSNRRTLKDLEESMKNVIESYNGLMLNAGQGEDSSGIVKVNGANFVNAVTDCLLRKVNTSDVRETRIMEKTSEATSRVIRVQNDLHKANFAGMVKKQPVFYESDYFRFSWDEYVNADLLICWMGSLGFEETESKALATIMRARSSQGKPTICFISTSLSRYRSGNMYEYYWSEMEDLKDNMPRLNRFTHVSCYRNFSTLGKTMCGIDDSKSDSYESKHNEFDDIDISEDLDTDNK